MTCIRLRTVRTVVNVTRIRKARRACATVFAGRPVSIAYCHASSHERPTLHLIHTFFLRIGARPPPQSMTEIDKLSIRGIRAFSPADAMVIEFYKPLTLIVGQNGSGKTVRIRGACSRALVPA